MPGSPGILAARSSTLIIIRVQDVCEFIAIDYNSWSNWWWSLRGVSWGRIPFWWTPLPPVAEPSIDKYQALKYYLVGYEGDRKKWKFSQPSGLSTGCLAENFCMPLGNRGRHYWLPPCTILNGIFSAFAINYIFVSSLSIVSFTDKCAYWPVRLSSFA